METGPSSPSVLCPSCGQAQPGWIRACRSCGARLAASCGVCGRTVPAGRERCWAHAGTQAAAGTALGAPADGARPARVDPPPPGPRSAGVPRPFTGRRQLQAILIGAAAFLVGAAGAGALFIATSSAEQRVEDYLHGSGQKPFVASDAGFRATFPSVPRRETLEMSVKGIPVATTMYISEVDGSAFAVLVTDLARPEEFDLNLAANGAAAGVDGRVESSRLTTIGGFPAAEFVVSAGNGRTHRAAAIPATHRLFMLQVAGADVPAEAFDRFTASFEILEP